MSISVLNFFFVFVFVVAFCVSTLCLLSGRKLQLKLDTLYAWVVPPATVWPHAQPLWTLSSCAVNKGILRTISVTRPDAMVINWLFYCELIVGHAHEAIWQPLLLVLAHWPLLPAPLRPDQSPSPPPIKSSLTVAAAAASIVYCFYAIVCLLPWTASASAVDLKQPKCEMSFQTEIEFLVTVAKAGYLCSFFFL